MKQFKFSIMFQNTNIENPNFGKNSSVKLLMQKCCIFSVVLVHHHYTYES